jgi:hypothetical protein
MARNRQNAPVDIPTIKTKVAIRSSSSHLVFFIKIDSCIQEVNLSIASIVISYLVTVAILPEKYPCKVVPVIKTNGNCKKSILKKNRSSGKNIWKNKVAKLKV